jgi:hypothetical protein
MRKIISLPDDLPEGLFEELPDIEDLPVWIARVQGLFRYFGVRYEGQVSVTPRSKQDAEKLAFSLAALIFPIFRTRRGEMSASDLSNPRGRPKASKPKYSIKFLIEIATLYEQIKENTSIGGTLAPKYIYRKLLEQHPSVTERLRVNGKPVQLSSFSKLLASGRSARDVGIIWHLELRKYVKITELNTHPVIAGILEGARHLTTPFSEQELLDFILYLSDDYKNTTLHFLADYIYDKLYAQLQRQIDDGVQSPVQALSAPPIDPLWLMKKNGKFNS